MRAVLAGTRVAEVSDAKLPEVMAVDEMASDAVTEPICAVPAANVGSVAKETGWVVWKNVPLTGTVPEMLAVTLPICEVPVPIVTEPAIVCVPVGLAVTVPAIVTVLPTVTVPEMGKGLVRLTNR